MQMQIQRWLVSLVVISALITGGCSSEGRNSTSSASPSVTETASASVAPVAAEQQITDLPRLEGKATVELVVKGTPITIEVDGTNAPLTAGNFVDLVKRGVYDGLVFHRVVREPQPFVVQGGDPQSKDPNFPPDRLGTGGFVDPGTSQPRNIPLEIKPQGAQQPVYDETITAPPVLKHTRGAVAMARSTLPNSASSQFYIALSDLQFLDGNYAVFGYVTDGMDVVDKIQQGDRIESARVLKGIENLKNAGNSASPSPSPSPEQTP